MSFNFSVIKYKTGYQVCAFSDIVGYGNSGRIDDELDLDYLDINGNVHVVTLGSETGKTSSKEQSYDYNPFTGEYEKIRSLEDAERSLRSSRNRTKRNLFYDARSNVWEWFVTFTFAPDKVDRFDYDAVVGKMHGWLCNIKKSFPDMKYIVVPELHKDGAYHFHGLFANCDNLDFKESGKFDKNGNMIYNIGRYRYGWSTAEVVIDTQCVSNYIGKYITKELCAVTFGRKRYWKSRNLEQAEKLNLTLLGRDKEEFMEQLYELSAHIKQVKTDFVNIKYFELPSDIGVEIFDARGGVME